MPNIYNPSFNQNVVEVYTEEPGFTGFKGLDFTKIDSIESILESGTNATLSGANVFLSSIASDTSGLNSKVFATGDAYPGGVQGSIVFQADLTQQFDAVTIFPEQSTGISNFTVSGSNGLVLPANSYRREFFVQNLDNAVLYVKYGLGANASSFNVALAASNTVNTADGGSLNDQSYVGDVSVSGAATPKYIAWERTNINRIPLV